MASIAEVQAVLAARAKDVPAGGFIASMGGWNPAQFVEKRLPTLAELDAGRRTSRAGLPGVHRPGRDQHEGREFFTGKGVAVSETGAIAANAPSLAALNALRAAQTFEDRKRGSRSHGLRRERRLHDQRGHGRVQSPRHTGLQGSFEADTLASADQGRMYDAESRCTARGR